jgi:hypothetical protein
MLKFTLMRIKNWNHEKNKYTQTIDENMWWSPPSSLKINQVNASETLSCYDRQGVCSRVC